MTALPEPMGVPNDVSTRPIHISIIVPLYDEEDNVEPLVSAVTAAMARTSYPWELILVSDGSTDATEERARKVRRRMGSHIRLLALQRNFGQTAAMQAGFDAARGDVIATLDGDLQNDPADLPPMIDDLIRRDLDLIVGWRRKRKEPFWSRRLPSKVANRLIGRVTGISLHDYGCSLKVYRGSIIRSVRLYGEMHRFIPAWVALTTSAKRIEEREVTDRPRVFGTSKYRLGRVHRVALDLLSVYFFMKFRSNPGQFFGGMGLVLGLTGGAILGYLGWVRIVGGHGIAGRPLMMLALLLVFISVQLITTGILSEMLARVYYEAGGTRSYLIRPQILPTDETLAWKTPDTMTHRTEAS